MYGCGVSLNCRFKSYAEAVIGKQNSLSSITRTSPNSSIYIYYRQD